jgi:hypothetical protein
MDLGLKGRRVLVTGGSQGIGLAVARGKERLAQAVAELRVVAVNPDGVETERMEAIQRARAEKEFGDASRWREYFADKPLRRTASPQELANVILFLASDKASWVSGAVVPVDGGFLHRRIGFEAKARRHGHGRKNLNSQPLLREQEHLVGANVSSVAPSSHSSRCDARRAKSHASLLIASV